MTPRFPPVLSGVPGVSGVPGALDVMQLVGVLASVGLVVIGLLAARHIGRVPAARSPTRGARVGHHDPVALPLALLAWDLAIWTLATSLYTMTGEPAWHWLDVTFSPFTPPLALHLVLAYTGAARRFVVVLRVAYVAFGLLSLSSALAFALPWARAWVGSSAWSIVYLAGWLPLVALALTLLVQALRRARDLPLAAMRARLLIAAQLVAALLGSTEMWDDLVQVPSLGVLGAFVAMLLMAAVVMRFDLFVGTVRKTLLLYAVTVSAVAIAALALVLNAPGLGALPLLALVALILALVALAVREVVRSGADRAARASYLASLGRFSAQMAHDLKNPLAAMKGAVQYLEAERASAGAPATEPDMLALVGKQVGRMEAIIERYRRLARTEVAPIVFAPDALVAEIVGARTAGRPGLVVVIEARAPEPWRGDRDLVASALENLVDNAIDAMGGAGALTVRARRQGDLLELEVADSGPGIDPRFLEHVADDFFTTKTDGSGLGLAFVRRVAVAHGGSLAIDSAPGRGTCVRVTLVELAETP